MEDNRDMVVEDECVVCIQNLGGSLVLIFIRASILICVVAVVVREFLVPNGSGMFRGGF